MWLCLSGRVALATPDRRPCRNVIFIIFVRKKPRHAKQLNYALNSVKDNEVVFKSRITKISVEMIGENEESIIIIEKQLC